MDTIVAISTPVGRGGIGVVRLSGNPLPIALKLFTSTEIKPDEQILPKYMYFGTISACGFSDKGYMVYFKAPKSYTGEDIVEFHLHGGMRIVEGIVSACAELGARPAERGEFTKRAFLNGKLALSDAEGVIDMINADSTEAVRAAYRMMTGHLSGRVKELQNRLTDVITALEAVLDYPEELEDETLPETKQQVADVYADLSRLTEKRAYGKMVKNGIDVALIGDTNVGKSSLLNAMLGFDRAIVSNVRGTTRDTVSESMEYKGKKFNFIDTAGIRESEDVIENYGVKRALSAVKTADLVIRLHDLTAENDEENQVIDLAVADKRVIDVYNKKDIAKGQLAKNENDVYLSAKTKEGVDDLLDKIAQVFEAEKPSEGEVLTSERHLFAVKAAADKLAEVIKNFDLTTTDCNLTALTEAWKDLGEITGETVTEKIIDNIFDKFCVGK